jgi:acyl-CoA thioester hydrolase
VTGFYWPVRVYYEDTDSGGVVYYANYLKFMERARTELLRKHGFEQDQLIENEGIVFAVRSLSVDYIRPARFNDLLKVSASIIHFGKASIEFEQHIIKEEDQEPLCIGKVKIACLDDRSFRPKPIPKNLITEIANDD